MPDILIIPQRGTSNNPVIQFTGSSAANIKMEILPAGQVAYIGTSGSLFNITDNLLGSLMAVGDVSGLPILEVFSDDRVVMGKYNANTLYVSGTRVGIGKIPTNAVVDVSGSMSVSGSFTATGLVGIGTSTNSSYALNVGGNVNVPNGYSYVTQGYNNNGGFALNNAGTYWGIIANYATNDWRIGYGSINSITQNWNFKWDNTGAAFVNSALYVPIVYDSDNTGYYVNPASTSNLNALTIAGSNVLYENAWINSKYFETSGVIYSQASMRAPIFYDYNDTNYYVDPNGSSKVTANFDVYGSIGTADDVRTGLRMYDTTAQAANIGGQIVLGYKYTNAGGYTEGAIIKMYKENNTDGHYGSGLKFEVRNNGENLGTRVFIDPTGNLQGDESARFPIFYDYNNTGYYADPASRSYFNSLNINGDAWITFNNEEGAWGIRTRNALSTTNLSTNLKNIIYNGGGSSEGLAIKGAEYLGITAMEIQNNGNVWSYASMRAPIFYDSNNTGYYVDPNGTSNLNNVSAIDFYANDWFRNVNSGEGLYNQANAMHWYSGAGGYWDVAPGGSVTSFTGIRMRTGGHDGAIRGYFYANTGNDVGLLDNGGNWKLRIAGGDYVEFAGTSIRSQMLYDVNDTNYYLNPNGTSWIGYPTYIGGSIALTEDRWINNKYFSSGGTTYLPFIYDSNDTTYYIDPANVSYLYEPRMAWRTLIGEQSYDATLFDGGTGYRSGIVVRGNYPHIDLVSSNINNGNHGPTLRFVAYDTAGATSGNFKHWVMGCAGTNAIRFSIGYDANQSNPHYGIYGAGTTVLWIENDSNVFFNSSIRPTIMYDRNNTSYYVDPASTSYLYTLQVGNTLSDPNNNGIIRLYGNLHIDAYNGYDIYANYYSGRRFRTFYSSNTEAFRSDTDGIVYAYNQFRTPVFYDYNNTNYYVDPDSTSVLNTISLSGVIRNNGGVNDDDSFGIYWDSGTSSAYAIYREAGAWNYPYPDLRIAFHTGIKLGAAASYQGIKFYNDYDMATQVMSVNNGSDGLGANNVYVNNSLQAGSSLRAPTFYDSDNTSYYTDPASTSVVNNVQITTLGVGTAASGTGGEIRATNNITAYYSDERLKTKLGPIENPIEKVKSLSGFYFSPNDTAMALGYKKTVDVGVSAQQVKEILPEIIAPAPIDPQYMTVRYEKLIPLLIEAIKEQQGQIDDLKNQISTLLSKNG